MDMYSNFTVSSVVLSVALIALTIKLIFLRTYNHELPDAVYMVSHTCTCFLLYTLYILYKTALEHKP